MIKNKMASNEMGGVNKKTSNFFNLPFKAVIVGLTWWLNRKTAILEQKDYLMRDTPTLKKIYTAYHTAIKKKQWNPMYKWLCGSVVNIYIRFLKTDNAYKTLDDEMFKERCKQLGYKKIK